MAIFLSEADVQALLTMEDALSVVEGAFRAWGEGRAVNRPRGRVRVPKGFLHLMPAASLDEGVMGFKAYSTIAGGKARFIVVLFSSETGEILALIEADRLGQMRTGAASGVAAKFLARKDAKTVGLIGAGYQAETQLEAVCRVRQIERVRVYSRTSERRERFVKRMGERLDVKITSVASAEEAVRAAEIVITITTAREPVLLGEWLEPGMCLLAAGSNHWLRRELDAEAVAKADRIVVDDLEQAKIECGDLLHAVERGLVRWEQIYELRDVVAGVVPGRLRDEEITLFESQGLALEDISVGAYVVRLARQRGRGSEIELS